MSKTSTSNFVNEIEEIIDNIKAVKGEAYSSALLVLLNQFNTYRLLNAIMGEQPEDIVHTVCTIQANATSDAFYRLAVLLQTATKPVNVIAKDLRMDVFALLTKQDEYSTAKDKKEP